MTESLPTGRQASRGAMKNLKKLSQKDSFLSLGDAIV